MLQVFFKGNEFIDECKKQGWHVVLLTVEHLLAKPWVRESIDELYALPSFSDRRAVLNTVAYLMRERNITRFAPLDDYDVELVAAIREHTRVPGMGDTTSRYFRDKLAMRQRAQDRGIKVPDFVGLFNRKSIAAFFRSVPGPWLLKPRGEASAVGIRKLTHGDQIWPILDELGDRQHDYLVEQMIPGDVCHVDSLVWDREIVFAEAHQYRTPLFNVMHDGGIFATRTIDRGSSLEGKLLEVHKRLVSNFGLLRGVTHTEYIVGRDDGEVYFLETAARVGGVHISDLVEASSGLNLWREWAKIELSQGEWPYAMGTPRKDYAGLIVTLAKQAAPDTSHYTDPEIVWRMNDHEHHVGLIVRSPDRARVEALLTEYERRFLEDFHAKLPAPKAATA